MCFGMTTTQQQTNTPSPVVQSAGQQAFGFARVADLTGAMKFEKPAPTLLAAAAPIG